MSHGNRGLSQIMVRLCCKKGSGPFIHEEYEADKRKRLGEEGAKPKRIRYKPISR